MIFHALLLILINMGLVVLSAMDWLLSKFHVGHCHICKHWIWPWQYCLRSSGGFFVSFGAWRAHPKCALMPQAYQELIENPEQWHQQLLWGWR